MFLRILNKKLVGGTNILERSRPASAFIANPAIFNIRGGQSQGCEPRAKMPRVLKAIFSAPKATMDVHHQGSWFGLASLCWKSKIDKLIRIRTEFQPEIGGWWLSRKYVLRHSEFRKNYHRRGRWVPRFFLCDVHSLVKLSTRNARLRSDRDSRREGQGPSRSRLLPVRGYSSLPPESSATRSDVYRQPPHASQARCRK